MLSSLADFVRSHALLRKCAHAAVRLIPDRPHTIKVPDLGPVRIRMRRHRHMLWENAGVGEALMMAIFRRLIRPGDVVYDIGANIGLYTRMMIAWFGADRVIAFEPMRENFDLLQANIALGKLGDRVQAFQLALSDAEGDEELQIDDMTSGTAVLNSISGGKASIGRQEFGLLPLTERVEVVRLDDFIETRNLPPPQVMKIDTEGAEVKVLRGAMETLRGSRPRLAIALHALDKTIGTLAILDELGYFTFGFAQTSGGDRAWRQLHASDAETLAENNIIASAAIEDVQDPPSPSGRGPG
jgi:FkbM family methyltransferase